MEHVYEEDFCVRCGLPCDDLRPCEPEKVEADA